MSVSAGASMVVVEEGEGDLVVEAVVVVVVVG